MKYSKILSIVSIMAVFSIVSTETNAECTKTCRNAITPHLLACAPAALIQKTMTPLQCAEQAYTAAGAACNTSSKDDCKAYANSYVPGIL